MALTAEEILEHLRALPARERLHVIERAVREVAEETPEPEAVRADDDEEEVEVGDAIWADVSDEEYQAFIEGIWKARAEPWRTVG